MQPPHAGDGAEFECTVDVPIHRGRRAVRVQLVKVLPGGVSGIDVAGVGHGGAVEQPCRRRIQIGLPQRRTDHAAWSANEGGAGNKGNALQTQIVKRAKHGVRP